MEKIVYQDIVDKTKWGDGPWMSEPDKAQWQDPETGLPCLIVRGPHGGLCGYVGVPPGHPAYGKHYFDIKDQIEVHGDLTYAAPCSHGEQSHSICHIPAEGEPDDVHWFGFDCAHAWDYSPSHDWRYPPYEKSTTYRDWAYVEDQVRQLASQLKGMEVDK